jgi:hypothetical protein
MSDAAFLSTFLLTAKAQSIPTDPPKFWFCVGMRRQKTPPRTWGMKRFQMRAFMP